MVINVKAITITNGCSNIYNREIEFFIASPEKLLSPSGDKKYNTIPNKNCV
jgi:hypothetical protein